MRKGPCQAAKSFTILEIIVCLSLLATLISTIAIVGVKVMASYKEETEIRGLQHRIKTICLLAPVLYSSGELYMKNSEKGLEMYVNFYFAPNMPLLKKETYPHLSIKDNELCLPFAMEGFAKESVLVVYGSKEHYILL